MIDMYIWIFSITLKCFIAYFTDVKFKPQDSLLAPTLSWSWEEPYQFWNLSIELIIFPEEVHQTIYTSDPTKGGFTLECRKVIQFNN